MTLHDISHDTPADSGQNALATGEQLARQQAIKQIERRRHFWVRATMGTLTMIIVVIIWAITEYHNAGGWPTQGFSDSSSIPNVWNDWIIYPAIAWVVLTTADALLVFRNKPISETEIKREIERQAGPR
jgi:2TM domain